MLQTAAAAVAAAVLVAAVADATAVAVAPSELIPAAPVQTTFVSPKCDQMRSH